jgi:hypothetical protein
MMKTYVAGLQTSTQTSYANNGKTTMLGRAFQKSINSQSVIGPALTQFIDVQTLAGFIPSQSFFNPSTGHLFLLGPTSPTPIVALFNFNNATGAYSYVGKVTLALGNVAATTYVLRGFKVYENAGVINVLVSVTGSIAINGGTYVGWGLAASDFTIGGTSIFSASGSNQKAVYFLQDPAAVGSAHVATTSWGIALPYTSSNGAVNTKLWQFNGTLALPQLYSWDLSLTPTVAGIITNGISAQTTLYAGTSPSAFFTMGASSNGYANGDPIVLMAGTGAVPTAFSAWASGTAQTAAVNVYFIRDLQLVSGNYYFNLTATTGGVAITPTSSTASFSMLRAFGTNTSLFSLKTGVLSPAFTLGTILQNNSCGYANPISAPANTALNGQDCLYFMTTLGLYLGKISDLTSLSTSWASMTFTGINISGTGIDITVPSAANGTYSGQGNAADIDRFIYATNVSTFVIKPYQASNITDVFGGVTNTYYETLNPVTVQAGVAAITDTSCYGGWLFICSSTIGQRGVVFVDMYSDANFGNSGVISPVLNIPAGSTFKEINTIEQLFNYTDSMNFWVRNGATSTDAVFASGTLPLGSPSVSGATSNGWTNIQTSSDLSAITIGPFFQLCVTFQIATLLANTPAQLSDLLYTVIRTNEISDNWEGSVDNTTQNGASPAYTAFRLQVAYATAVPTMYFRAYDDNGNLVASANTSANPTLFQYTTNNGTSWSALGTVPNTALTTELRYLWPTPPGVRVTSSIRES